MTRPTQISIQQARKIALLSQHLPITTIPRGLAGTREAVRRLGYVQIDTISVVQRAHHHTLWNRVPHYRPRYLDKLTTDRTIFEYWSHAAAYLPMEDYRFCLPRMNAIANGQRHWYPSNPKLMNEVLDRVRTEGPLQAKDFEAHRGSSGSMWEWGPVKQAIERLFMEGKLLITRRHGFQKLFDLAERVVPVGTDTRTPDRSEYAHFLIERYLKANGIGRLPEFGYLRRNMGSAIKQALAEKLEAGDVVPVTIRGNDGNFYAANYFTDTLSRRLYGNRLKILSPFDNLIIQRQRNRLLFGYDYQLECYVPANKRKHGYFCLPILWRGRLVARMDAKAERKNRLLLINNLHTEARVGDPDLFGHSLGQALGSFLSFNQCDNVVLGKIAPSALKEAIRKGME